MITVLGTKRLVWFFAVLLLLGYLTACLIGWQWPTVPVEIVRTLAKSLAISSVLLALLGNHRVIDFLWKKIRCLNLIAPNLNGTYRLKNSSNWPIKQRMLQALGGVSTPETSSTSVLDVVGELRIQMGLFGLQVSYEPSEAISSRSRSSVIASSFNRPLHAGTFEFSYVYLATTIQPKGDTDEQQYYGCAHLSLPTEARSPSKLIGNYFTNRKWSSGLNTAGQVEATRIG